MSAATRSVSGGRSAGRSTSRASVAIRTIQKPAHTATRIGTGRGARMSKYLVTGGAGFIGLNLVYHLLGQGEKVVVYDNYSTGKKKWTREFSKDVKLVEGDILAEVYGPTGNEELARVLDNPDQYRVVTENVAGRKIHTRAEKFFQITESGFCGTCHDVTLVNGFRLEEAFSEYKQRED